MAEEDRGMRRAQVLLRLQTKAKAASSRVGTAFDLSEIPPELDSPLNRGEEQEQEQNRASLPFYQACQVGTGDSLRPAAAAAHASSEAEPRNNVQVSRGRKVPQWLASQPRLPPPPPQTTSFKPRMIPPPIRGHPSSSSSRLIHSQRARPSYGSSSPERDDDEDAFSNASDVSFHSVESRVHDLTLATQDGEAAWGQDTGSRTERAFPIRALKPGDFIEEHEAKYRTQHHGNVSLKQARDLLYRISQKGVRPSTKLSHLEHLLDVDITPQLAQGLILAQGGSMGLSVGSSLPALCIDMFQRFEESRDPESVQCLYKILHLFANCLSQLDSSRDRMIRVILDRCEAIQYDLIRGLLSVCEDHSDCDLPEEDQSKNALANMSAKVLFLLTNKRSMKRFSDCPEKVEAMARTMLKKPHKYQQLAAVRILKELYRRRHDDTNSLPQPMESSKLAKELGEFLLARTALDAVYCLYFILDLMPESHLIATFNLCKIPKVMEEVLERERDGDSDTARLARKIKNLTRQNSVMLQESLWDKAPGDKRLMNRNYTEKQWQQDRRMFEDQRQQRNDPSRDSNREMRRDIEPDEFEKFQGDYLKRQASEKFSDDRRHYRDENNPRDYGRPGGRGPPRMGNNKNIKVSLADVVNDLETDYVTGNQPARRPRPVADGHGGGGMSSIEGDSSEAAASASETNPNPEKSTSAKDKGPSEPTKASFQPAAGIKQEKKKQVFHRGHIFPSLKKFDNVAIMEAVSRMDIDKNVLAMHICAFLNSGNSGMVVIGVKNGGEFPVIQGIAMDRTERDYFRQGFDTFLNGQIIQPRLVTSILKLEFFDVIDRRDKERQLIFINVGKSGGSAVYKITSGLNIGRSYTRRGKRTVDLT